MLSEDGNDPISEFMMKRFVDRVCDENFVYWMFLVSVIALSGGSFLRFPQLLLPLLFFVAYAIMRQVIFLNFGLFVNGIILLVSGFCAFVFCKRDLMDMSEEERKIREDQIQRLDKLNFRKWTCGLLVINNENGNQHDGKVAQEADSTEFCRTADPRISDEHYLNSGREQEKEAAILEEGRTQVNFFCK